MLCSNPDPETASRDEVPLVPIPPVFRDDSRSVFEHDAAEKNGSAFLAKHPSATHAHIETNLPWLPCSPTASNDTNQRIRRELSAEKAMTFSTCCQRYPKAIAWSLLIFLTVVMEAYGKSLVSGFIALPAFRRQFGQPKPPLSEDLSMQAFEISPLWQMGLQNAAVSCEIIGLFANGYMAYHLGYRKTMMISLVWLASAVTLAFFANSMTLFLVSQALCGFSWGVIQTLAATYAAEVVPSTMRAYVLSNVNMCWLIGQVLGTGALRSVVHNTSAWSYRIPWALQWAWAAPLLLAVYFAPESPWWLVRHGRLSGARQSLRRLSSRKHLDVDDTITMMCHINSVEKRLNYGGASYADLYKGVNLRRTEITCAVWSCQALCGASLFGYAPYFLEQAGFNSSHSFSLATGMYGLGILGGMISWFLFSVVGRRRLYLAGLVASLALLMAGGLTSTFLENKAAMNWAVGVLIILMSFAYNLTIGPACYVVVAEIPSTRLRVKTVAFGRVVYNIFTIINNILMPRFLNPTALDLSGKSCFVYAGTALLCLVWCFLRLPETRGLSYLELDILFEKKASTSKFRELQERLANTAYISASGAERLRNAWHGWLAYS